MDNRWDRVTSVSEDIISQDMVQSANLRSSTGTPRDPLAHNTQLPARCGWRNNAELCSRIIARCRWGTSRRRRIRRVRRCWRPQCGVMEGVRHAPSLHHGIVRFLLFFLLLFVVVVLSILPNE